ncbi:hypothetical protein M405DRAFT_564393 [Rhizopogon salebrosus TDB-379]|nr:hypothetical protein M405DRAFT_564393 [Rhizopogon salebrosus TDB-379]
MTLMDQGRCIISHRFAKRRSTEADAALTLLSEHVENKSVPLKTAAIVGLGVAYAGLHPEDLLALLLPAAADKGVSMEIASLSAAFVLGFGFVGSRNGEITSTILQMLIERVKSWIRSVGGSWRWGWRFFMSDLILQRVMRMLEPDDRFVFSTCSLIPFENEAVIPAALDSSTVP